MQGENSCYRSHKRATVHSVPGNTLHDARIYADRINSCDMSRVFCDLRSQKTPRGILLERV